MTQAIIRICVFLIVLFALGTLGLFALTKYRGQGALLRADEAYAEERWRDAKRNYTWYAVRHPENLEVLPRYIESCLKLLDNRRAHIRDAGRAYLKLTLDTPADTAKSHELIDFYRRFRLWRELDYAAYRMLRDNPEDPYLLYNKALAASHLGRNTQAISIYRELLGRDDIRPDVYGNLALLLFEQDLEEQGWQVLEKAIDEQSDNPLIRLERAKFLLATNDLMRASEEIEIALSSNIQSGEVYLTASKVHAAQTQWEAAYDFSEKAVKEMPDSVEAHFQVVTCLMSDRQVENTITYITNIDPYILADHPTLYLTLAEIQINSDLLADAKRTIETFRSVYPNDRNIMEYLSARILLKLGNATEAASKLGILVERAPELRVAQYALGIAYLESEQRVKAKNTFELYLSNNPDDRRARVIWNSIFAGRTLEDIETVAFGLLDSETPYFRSLIVTAQSLAKNLTRSDYDDDAERLELVERLFKRAITESPEVPDTYRDLGFFYLDQENLEATRQLLERANEAGVDRMELNLLRAALALRESRPEQAQTLFEDELNVKVKGPSRILQWATLFAEQGYPEIGIELFDAARKEVATEENRAELDLAQISFYAQTDNFESATALIQTLSGKPSEIPGITTQLNDKRLAISRQLIASDEQPDDIDIDQLIQTVELTEPDRSDAKIVRVRLMLQQEPVDLARAIRLCAAARDAGATDIETYLISSEIAYKTGLFDDALKFAVTAHEASPDNLSTNFVLARMQLQTGQLNDAILTLEKIHSRLPENRSAINLLARAYAGIGRFNDAERTIQRLEYLEDGRIQVSLRAWLLIARGNWADAEELLSTMYKGNLDDLWTIHFLVVAMENQGKWEEAQNFLSECIIRRPELPDIWVELGNSYLRDPGDQDFSRSSHAYTKALIRQTGYSRAIRGLLDVQLRTNNLGAALALCNRLLVDVPNDSTVLQQKSLILSHLPGRRDDALAAIQLAIDIKPKPTYFYFRGLIRLDKGDYANAIEDFQRIDNVGGGGFDDIDLLMADAYLGLNNFSLAQSYYDVADSKASQQKDVDSGRMNRIKLRLVEESKK